MLENKGLKKWWNSGGNGQLEAGALEPSRGADMAIELPKPWSPTAPVPLAGTGDVARSWWVCGPCRPVKRGWWLAAWRAHRHRSYFQ